VRVVVGSLYGASSPVPTVHETIFGDVHLKPGSKLPLDTDHEERAVYVIDGVSIFPATSSKPDACSSSSPATP
jgi:redox-sensitive bicupin YhaK (pirin superfamily)